MKCPPAEARQIRHLHIWRSDHQPFAGPCPLLLQPLSSRHPLENDVGIVKRLEIVDIEKKKGKRMLVSQMPARNQSFARLHGMPGFKPVKTGFMGYKKNDIIGNREIKGKIFLLCMFRIIKSKTRPYRRIYRTPIGNINIRRFKLTIPLGAGNRLNRKLFSLIDPHLKIFSNPVVRPRIQCNEVISICLRKGFTPKEQATQDDKWSGRCLCLSRDILPAGFLAGDTNTASAKIFKQRHEWPSNEKPAAYGGGSNFIC